MEVSDSITGEWRAVPGFTLANEKGYEGPACYRLAPTGDGKPAKWCLVMDAYIAAGGYKPYVTDDLASGKFTPGEKFEFPFVFRHGSVLPLNAEEFERLQAGK